MNDMTDGTWIWLTKTDAVIAAFRLVDAPRAEATNVVRELMLAGLEVHLLSGDAPGEVSRMAGILGISAYRSGASPEQKVEYLHTLRSRLGGPVAMVGDGVNDAPVLASADVSFAMGDSTDLARTAADAVLLRPNLALLPTARNVALATRKTVNQNLGWALVYNVGMIPLAALGWIPPWAAALGMSASSLVVVANALRVERKSAHV